MANIAIGFVSGDIAYLNLLAMASERVGNYQRSLTLLESISVRSTKNVSLKFMQNFIRILSFNGKYQSAIDHFRSISENDDIVDVSTLAYISICLFNVGEYEECLHIMDKALENCSDSSIENELLITLARIIYSIDQIDNRIEIAKEQFYKW